MTVGADPLAATLPLPCGAVLANRLCRSAMTEGMADEWLRATLLHETLYRRWSHGGAALQVTGNVMIDHRVLERPGNVCVDVTWAPSVSAEARGRLARWARAGTEAGNHLWMQLSHAGRQSPRYVTSTPVAPSDVPLELLGNYARPRALAEDEIPGLVERFARAAAIARECGFTGVQLHSAHGYLLSSFLSPLTNRRQDAWGGPIANRARFLIEALRATRREVGADFPVGIKLNSDDFRKGGFSHEDCLAVVQLLNAETVDLLEISGGTYEQPRLLGFEGLADSVMPVRPSTRAREAYFLEYAAAIRRVARMPLMVTGGFRSRGGMEAALASGDCDLIGLARPLCVDPDFPRRLLERATEAAPGYDARLVLARRGLFSPASPATLFRAINVLGAQAWYGHQMLRLAQDRPVEPGRGVLRSFLGYSLREYRQAWRIRGTRCP